MHIIRKALNDYVTTEKKKPSLTKRQVDDWDLAFNGQKVYMLGEREWFDPVDQDPSDSDRMSKHAYIGPSIVLYGLYAGEVSCHAYHVNDPSIWTYFRRVIRGGHLSAETLLPHPGPELESEVQIPEEKENVPVC